MPNGLKLKYNVTKVEDGTPVYDCFVLRPDKDPAARAALKAYADATMNDALCNDIRDWIKEIEASIAARGRKLMKDSMKALCADIEAAGEKELARAAEKFGATNNSPHESYAVIKEEFEEAKDEAKIFKRNYKAFWESVKANNAEDQRARLMSMMEASRNASAEWTQVYAMCVKALKKKEQ